jgi:hypothetical protein
LLRPVGAYWRDEHDGFDIVGWSRAKTSGKTGIPIDFIE